MYALLGNGKGKVKPWYLPFDWCFCMVDIKGYAKVRIVKNSVVANVYALPVELVDGVVVGLYEHKPHLTKREPDGLESEQICMCDIQGSFNCDIHGANRRG